MRIISIQITYHTVATLVSSVQCAHHQGPLTSLNWTVWKGQANVSQQSRLTQSVFTWQVLESGDLVVCWHCRHLMYTLTWHSHDDHNNTVLRHVPTLHECSSRQCKHNIYVLHFFRDIERIWWDIVPIYRLYRQWTWHMCFPFHIVFQSSIKLAPHLIVNRYIITQWQISIKQCV